MSSVFGLTGQRYESHLVSCQLPTHSPAEAQTLRERRSSSPGSRSETPSNGHMSEIDQRKPRLETANAVETLILLVGEGERAEKTATRVIPRRMWDIDRVATGIEAGEPSGLGI
ncbi:hypothetical protein H0G86_000688 [Trichoderma simmonsii]|uniref:Uncharacterized protein n=1 Tax=Trichoderma simmonsii TaxID=1491479 RepID=A0A8G0L365_9HYPO|nr:hypothetical protein H0G86_000688 [Trichoderma simmonsii]